MNINELSQEDLDLLRDSAERFFAELMQLQEPGFIDCTHFALTAAETMALRLACRKHGTTIQGALVAAALITRIKLLSKHHGAKEKFPLLAAVQIPVNTRILIAGVDEEECLCGSAGVWHTARIVDDSAPWELAKHSTACVRALLQPAQDGGVARQPHEWLRRLFHEPSTLPPYSLMPR